MVSGVRMPRFVSDTSWLKNSYACVSSSFEARFERATARRRSHLVGSDFVSAASETADHLIAGTNKQDRSCCTLRRATRARSADRVEDERLRVDRDAIPRPLRHVAEARANRMPVCSEAALETAARGKADSLLSLSRTCITPLRHSTGGTLSS